MVARLRPYVATTAIVAGALLLLVTGDSAVNAIRVLTHAYSPNEFGHDVYYIVGPSIWLGLLIYGAGVVAVLAFRAMAAGVGRHARLLWRTHLVFTTVLIFVALVVDATGLIESAWQMAFLVNGACVLLLLAHGAALIMGGMLLLRARQL